MTQKFKVGDRVRFLGSGAYAAQRGAMATILAAGEGLLKVRWDRDGRDGGQMDGKYSHDLFKLISPSVPPLTPLDDAGRASLKKGDRVLVEAVVENATPDRAGDFSLLMKYGNDEGPCYASSSAIYARLPDAPKPIEVGATVRISTQPGSTGKVLALTSAGVPVVEYADGDGLTARTFDASALEVVS